MAQIYISVKSKKMLITPYDLQDKPLSTTQHKEINPVNKNKVYNEYSTKFRSAIYAFVLFILLSHKASYKILDIILKILTNRLDAIDNDENPTLVGTIVMAAFIALVIFLF